MKRKRICKYLTDKVLCAWLIITLTIPPFVIGFIWWRIDVELFSTECFMGVGVVFILVVIWSIAFEYAKRQNLINPEGK